MNASSDNAALLVIDVQSGLFGRSTPVYRQKELLAAVNLLLERARAAGAAVFIIQHGNDSFLKEETDGWRLHPEVRTAATDLLIRKHHSSAFRDTALQEELDRRGIGRLAVCGLVTHGCVNATCTDAVEKGYRVTLAADGHSSFHKQARAIIEEWNAKWVAAGIEVAPAASIRFTP
jgi:nicotinamidase-related amidase